MAKARSEFEFPGLELDRQSTLPIYQQVYESMRRAILERRLRPGQQLPPTRLLAEQLGVSRSTILLAFDHLLTEGYVTGKTGAGTFVSETIPEHWLRAKAVAGKEPQVPEAPPILSQRGRTIAGLRFGSRRDTPNLQPFRPGVPGLRDFPFETWARLLGRTARSLPHEAYGYGEAAGYHPLREAVADYLRMARAVRCEVGQVLIVNGSQQGLDLVARVLLDPGDRVWIEDPGYNGAKEAVTAAGATVAPVPVDREGIEVAAGRRLSPAARLVYVSPSHQYPLGVTMSLQRRLELLEWAAGAGAWILEDDYDSEYRYEGRPLSSLQGIDRSDRVIYLGTFSKVLFPGLRLAYLVVPPVLVDAFTAAKAYADRHSPILEQATLAAFIEEGHFGRHLRRTRLLYAERQEALIASINKHLQGYLTIHPSPAGLHVTGFLPPGTDDQAAAKAAARAGVIVPPLSGYSLRHPTPPGLVIGYAAYTPEEIEKGIKKIWASGA